MKKKRVSFFLSLFVVAVILLLIFVKCGVYDREAFKHLSSEDSYEEFGVTIVKIYPVTDSKEEFCKIEVEFDNEEDLLRFIDPDDIEDTAVAAATESDTADTAAADADTTDADAADTAADTGAVVTETESEAVTEEEEKPLTAILYMPAKGRDELKKNGFICIDRETGEEYLLGHHAVIKACDYTHDKKDFHYVIGLSYDGTYYLEPQKGIEYLVDIMNKKRALF